MSDILNEIDDALKREKAEKFWKEHGPTLIAGAVMLVVFTGIFSGWNGWKAHKAKTQTAILMSAMTAPDQPQALVKAADELSGGPRAIALMQAGGQLTRDGKDADALALYQAMARDSSVPGDFRDLAAIVAARLAFDARTADTDIQALYKSVTGIANDAKSPWTMHARVQAALIAGEGLKDYAAALKLLGVVLANEKAPVSLKERARALDHLYVLRASEAKDAPKDSADPTTNG